jgi:hypothetical protein
MPLECGRVTWRCLITVLFFFFGSVFPVLNSMILRARFPWHNGLTLQFAKPYFQLTAEFIGMALFIIPSVVYQRLRSTTPGYLVVSMRFDLFPKIVFPSLCNIASTGLQNNALLSIPVTVWQIFYGFRVLVVTLFAVTYRNQQLFLVHWLGLFVTVSGMAFSAVAAFCRPIGKATNSVSDLFFAFIIAIASHGIQAFQSILEEKLLHDEGINGATLTAYEGIWGSFFCLLIILPVCAIFNPTHSFGLYENTIETFEMFSLSGNLVCAVVLFVFVVTFYSYFGIAITELSTAIHRNIYEVLRPLPIWILNTLVHYLTQKEEIGEPIDRWAALELTGFGVSVLGLCIFNKMLRFPCFTYLDPPKQKVERTRSRSMLTESWNAELGEYLED